MSGSVFNTFADERLLADNLGISASHLVFKCVIEFFKSQRKSVPIFPVEQCIFLAPIFLP